MTDNDDSDDGDNNNYSHISGELISVVGALQLKSSVTFLLRVGEDRWPEVCSLRTVCKLQKKLSFYCLISKLTALVLTTVLIGN